MLMNYKAALSQLGHMSSSSTFNVSCLQANQVITPQASHQVSLVEQLEVRQHAETMTHLLMRSASFYAHQGKLISHTRSYSHEHSDTGPLLTMSNES